MCSWFWSVWLIPSTIYTRPNSRGRIFYSKNGYCQRCIKSSEGEVSWGICQSLQRRHGAARWRLDWWHLRGGGRADCRTSASQAERTEADKKLFWWPSDSVGYEKSTNLHWKARWASFEDELTGFLPQFDSVQVWCIDAPWTSWVKIYPKVPIFLYSNHIYLAIFPFKLKKNPIFKFLIY